MKKIFCNLKSTSRNLKQNGFALIASVMIMTLLLLIAFAMMSLSSTSSRSANILSGMEEAKANARMALMIAIGELQEQMGPDQRISANGGILDNPDIITDEVRHPHWAGVWDSWKAGVGESSQHKTIFSVPDQMSPTYLPNRSDYFRQWLVSLNDDEKSDIASAKDLILSASITPEVSNNAIYLVASGSLGEDSENDYVAARLLEIKDENTSLVTGRYGWWVGDESQKARIMSDSSINHAAATTAERIFQSQSPGSLGTRRIAGLQNISENSQLARLPSRANLDLVSDVVGRPSQQNFHHVTTYSTGVIADIREGGLKRDLSTILEQPINIANTGDEYMLYSFNSAGSERVPIQDLAAFYQLYDQTRYASTSESWRRGVSYNSSRIPNAVQIAQPELGASRTDAEQQKFLRQYQRSYKSVIPIKVQILVTMKAEPIPPASLVPDGNTHYVRLYMMPSVTLWNPTNLPLVMNLSNNVNFAQQMRFMSAGFNINWIKNNMELSPRRPLNLAFAAMGGDGANGRPGWGNAGGKKATMFDMYFATPNYPITFEPGEVRVFSYDQVHAGATPFQFRKHMRDHFQAPQQAAPGWSPDVLFPMLNSIWGAAGPNAFVAAGGNQFAIRETDDIAIRISTDLEDGTDYSHDSEWPGSAFSFMMIQNNHQSRGTSLWGFRNYPVLSRGYSTPHAQASYGVRHNTEFNDRLLRKGFPENVVSVNRSAASIIANSSVGQHVPLFQFALMAGTETSDANGAFSFGGRKFASRPFLHSSPISPAHIDDDNYNSLYNSSMNWWIEEVNSILEANIQVEAGNRRGYYGGGNTPQYGTTHLVQQEIPVVPPISIAGLSHAHLGGFSLASAMPNLTSPVVSAIGLGGVYPFTVRAIGNSYAHPLLAANVAYSTTPRYFNGSLKDASGDVTPTNVTFADHSYLANKALWDDFFFSSITPQNIAARVFGVTANKSARQVADDFFINNTPLTNRRLVPYADQVNSAKLDELFAEQSLFTNGLADKIAQYIMTEGSFNINSTSVDAWKALFSSLRGKPVTYLDKNLAMAGVAFAESTPTGVPVSGLSLPLASPQAGGSVNPAETSQWLGWRELTDTQINELSEAMVRQVKLRGPFLSLSEFVNRRLDDTNTELSVKGALQSALDDPAVSINEGFRDPARIFSAAEIATMSPAFPEALEGPIAYGSMAYVNQADILRNFSEQLTPRGDTFVVRAYGESQDVEGNIIARAWCEAVVQRFPEYIDTQDEAHIKQADLVSETNRNYGRRLEIISFRWLNPEEV